MMYLDDVQTRLTILYTLKCFKISMTEGNLQEALVWSEILDYFTMMDFLLDMINLGLASTLTIENETRFDITEKGEETLNMFRDKIPASIRDRIYRLAEKELNKLAMGREIIADIQPIDDKKFMAKCGIYEYGIPLMELNLFAGTRKQAEELAKKFEDMAPDLYKNILDKVVE